MLDSNGQELWTTQQAVEMTADLPTDLKEPVELVAETEEQISDELITEPLKVLEILLEICQVWKTVDEYLDSNNISILTDREWKNVFLKDSHIIEDIVNWFFIEEYDWKYAYIKQVNSETPAKFGAIWLSLGDKRELRTKYWKILVPKLTVQGLVWLFPVTALISDSELYLYNYTNRYGEDNDKHLLEQEIMTKLIELCNPKPSTIIETNNLFWDIEQMCKEAGTIKRVSFWNGVLQLAFDWRYWNDTDNASNNPRRILPPFVLCIDMIGKKLYSPDGYHPHRLGRDNLCLGSRLAALRDTCFDSKDLKGLTKGMIQFWNSWTSSDAQRTDRDPKECVKNYISNYWFSADGLPVKFIDLVCQQWYINNSDYKEYLRVQLANDSFAKEYEERTGNLRSLIEMLYTPEVAEEMIEHLFPNENAEWEN